MNLTNIEAMQIFIRLYNVCHSVETDEMLNFYPDRFVEVLNHLFTEDEINDLLSLAQGFSLRQVAKASTKKISHATMKKFETEAAITVNEEMYRRHYLHSEDDQYFFTQSSEYQLSKEYRQFDISMLVRLIRICIDYDTILFKDLKYLFKCRKDLLRKLRREIKRKFPATDRMLREDAGIANVANLSKVIESLEEKFDEEVLTIDEIRRLVKDAMDDRSGEVYLFGSYARNQASIHSDIDLIVDSTDPLLMLHLTGAIEEMCGNEIDYKCQVITMRQLKESKEKFRSSVEKDMMLIYDK
jgi:hypothetical protein